MHRSPDSDTGQDDTPGIVSTPVTIQISPHTIQQLDSLKKSQEEPYDTVISRLCDMATGEAPLDDETLKEIEKSLFELRKGISMTHGEILQELIAKKEE